MWDVILDPDFESWLLQLEAGVREEIVASANVLRERGPNLGRPYVDTLKGTNVSNLKELRVQYRGDPWRILFAFDPARRAILLVGGCKAGDKRFYKSMIPIAEERYQRHLRGM
ncbi:type II toxin-antitoxin system RelE/ParE family toxin [Paludisphaera rhizosphaerae]|uniref:type II toxin-antitoxin system RelE/ParE family toxin n=1 Tax=Paludisphaera rhizosphaerae TaxID=2711216 RepID=UPI0013EBCF52|nr:type II toxin-antitoxin system RelE/ParE family toxin [Paludisphaera rhizosphaerae]